MSVFGDGTFGDGTFGGDAIVGVPPVGLDGSFAQSSPERTFDIGEALSLAPWVRMDLAVASGTELAQVSPHAYAWATDPTLVIVTGDIGVAAGLEGSGKFVAAALPARP